MPRARKPRQDSQSDTPLVAGGSGAEDEGNRPSQLDAIREALATPPRVLPDADETPVPPSAEEPPELPPPAGEPEPPPPAAAAPETPPPAAAEKELDVPQAGPPVTQWVPPPTSPPPAPQPAAAANPGGPASSSLAVGIVLVVVGIFFLLIRLLDVDLSTYGWPLYVIIPGLTLLVVGFVSLGSGALIPGGIVTAAGLVLAYNSATEDWASWAYAWALVAPGGVGLGIFLQGLRVRDERLTRQGRALMFWAVLIFLIGFVFFESILNVSGHDYGKLGQAALPLLLIIIGITLLIRNFQRGRSA